MNRQVLKKVISYIKPYGFLVGLNIFMALCTVVSTLYIPIRIGDAIDCIIAPGNVDFDALKIILISMTAVIFVTGVCQWIMNTVNNRIVYSVTQDIRNAAFTHIQKLPVAYLDSHPSGDILSRVIADVDTFADGLLLGFTQLFTGVLTILGTLIFMIRVNVLTALVVIILTPLSLFVARFIAGRTHRYFEAQSKTRGRETAFINEMIPNARAVKAYGKEKDVTETFKKIDDELGKHALKATFYSSLVNPSTRFVNSIVYAAVGFSGAMFVLRGALTVGQLTCFLTYASQYAKPFNEISGVVTEFQNALVCAGRVFELMELETEEEVSSPAEKNETNTKGHVELKDIAFSYNPENPLIRDLSLEVMPGQHIAIVGRTGCGKTTLINLLMRFYDVNAGQIMIDGVDIRNIDRQNLRKMFGMVLQDTWLKAGTIRSNITLGKPDATEEEILKAAKATHADSFIRRLPEGYDTVIGEDGGGLSQGQKQLLCITRIMLSLPPMLILDEATSSIDTRTETRIQRSFMKMMEGRTTFIVAHRLSTIRNADRILVMDQGRVIEQGTHRELMEKKGFYHELYESQFRGLEV